MRGAPGRRVDIDRAMVVRAVGEKDAREHGGVWGAGPAMTPWLQGGGLWAMVPGGRRWLPVYVRARGGEIEVKCRCRQRPQYCTHSIAVMAYAAANMDALKERRAAEDAGLREAAGRAAPFRDEFEEAASGEAGRLSMHRLRLPPDGLPPRGLDYGRILDKAYMDMSRGCYLEETANVDFDEAADLAGAFAACGDVEEAARIHAAVAETIAKNTGIVDDSDAYYWASLQAALDGLVACMAGGKSGRKPPEAARRGHISWLVRRAAADDPDFFTEDFAKALDSACVSERDAAWRRKQESLHGRPPARLSVKRAPSGAMPASSAPKLDPPRSAVPGPAHASGP